MLGKFDQLDHFLLLDELLLHQIFPFSNFAELLIKVFVHLLDGVSLSNAEEDSDPDNTDLERGNE